MSWKFEAILTLLCLIISIKSIAQKVEKFTVKGKTYYGTKAIPEEIIGLYKYEETKEPIIQINKDGTGLFQVHDVKPYPCEFWIETDDQGEVQKQRSSVNKNYLMVLIVKFGSNGEEGWKGARAGQYDRISAGIDFERGLAIVLGERIRKLPN